MIYADYMKSTTLNIRIEPDIKEQAESIFRQLGLSSTTAINLFFRQVILHGGIPFALMTGQSQPLVNHDLPSAKTTGEHDRLSQVTTINSLSDEEILAIIRQVRKPHTQKTLQTAEEAPPLPSSSMQTGNVPPTRHSVPAFTTFDDESRAEAWQRQHDNEGI